MMQEKYFVTFSKKHLLLYLLLVITLIIPLIILLGVFTNWFCKWDNVADFSAWAGIVSGIITYIGAVILGVIAYYNAWLKQYCEEKIKCSFDAPIFCNGEFHQFYTFDEFYKKHTHFVFEYHDGDNYEHKTYDFKRLVFKNLNHNYPLNIAIKKVELSPNQDENYSDCTNEVMVVCNRPLSESFEYSNPLELYIGINQKLLDYWIKQDEFTLFNIRILFQLSNLHGSEYMLCELLKNGNVTGWHFLSKKEIKKTSINENICVSRIIDTSKD